MGDSLAHECGEAAAYGFVYAIAAALTGGVAERIFPDYNDTDEQAITLRSKFDGQTLCMTNEGKYVRGDTACSSESPGGLPWMAQWNFLPVG